MSSSSKSSGKRLKKSASTFTCGGAAHDVLAAPTILSRSHGLWCQTARRPALNRQEAAAPPTQPACPLAPPPPPAREVCACHAARRTNCRLPAKRQGCAAAAQAPLCLTARSVARSCGLGRAGARAPPRCPLRRNRVPRLRSAYVSWGNMPRSKHRFALTPAVLTSTERPVSWRVPALGRERPCAPAARRQTSPAVWFSTAT